MKLILYAPIVLATVCVTTATASPITYSLVDGGAGDQNSHTLSGFIEFDSACGSGCSTSNITDFSFTVSGPNNYTYSYSVPEDVGSLPGDPSLPNIIAGAGDLRFDFGVTGLLSLADSQNNVDPASLTWVTDLLGSSLYTSSQNTPAWTDVFFDGREAVIGVAVPEPQTLMLALTMTSLLLSRRTP